MDDDKDYKWDFKVLEKSKQRRKTKKKCTSGWSCVDEERVSINGLIMLKENDNENDDLTNT